MTKFCLSSFIAIAGLLLSCGDADPKATLTGKWALEKLTFKTELVSGDRELGVNKVFVTINGDGTYTYTEGTLTKSGTWVSKGGNQFEFVHEDQSSDTFEMLNHDGQMDFVALTIDLTSALGETEIAYVNLANLTWIAQNIDASGSTSLEVIFVFKPVP